jgi:predicted acetyltransferase
MKNTDLKLERSGVDDKDFIKNLYQLYLQDLSEFKASLQCNAMGSFYNSFVDSFYCKDNLIPLKITFANSIVGFLFCSTGRTVDYIIQDIFILKNYRNRGFGKVALQQLFALYPGRYGLFILMKNTPAKLFWMRCLECLGINYTSDEIVEDGEHCIKFIFDSITKN